MAELEDNTVIAERMNERRALADRLQNDAEFREKYLAEEKRAREEQAEAEAAEELARLTREYMGVEPATPAAPANAQAVAAPSTTTCSGTSTHVALQLDDPLPEPSGQIVIHKVEKLVINMCGCTCKR